MSVAILIVNYRSYVELDRCLASIERHEPGAEVVVVDHDADATRGAAVAAAHPRARVLPVRENPGFAAGVNRAASQSTAPLVLLLNPDVELQAPVLGPLVACLRDHEKAAIVGGRLLGADGAVQLTARRFPDWTTAFGGRTSWLTRVAPDNPLSRRNLLGESGVTEAIVVDWVAGAFVLMRREVFAALGGLDQRFFLYWEDADLCRRAADAGWQTMYEPRAEAVHLAARSSRHAPVQSLVAFHRSVFRYYWKHGGWLARGCAPLVALGLLVRFALRLPGIVVRNRREEPS